MKYLVFLIFILLVSCKADTIKVDQADNKSDTVEKPSTEISDEVNMDVLTLSNWEVEIVLDNGKINDGNPWKGSTLSFENNGLYSWKGELVNEAGNFTFDSGKNMIVLNANSADSNSEWSIKYRKSMMVWIGTPKFGHQALQLKLVRKSKNAR
jgi:hypothetical protein